MSLIKLPTVLRHCPSFAVSRSVEVSPFVSTKQENARLDAASRSVKSNKSILKGHSQN